MNAITTPLMQEATEALISNLLASEVFIRYEQAQIRLNEDRQARDLLEQLSHTQARLREKQSNGGVTQQDIDSLRAIQEKFKRNDIIMGYALAQQNAVDFLREINDEISQLLGIDFASFANRATC
jgi:cell fate (sporulation/competence/biofilm development) regulator YlbF (YheA/YmcA/DUF963 family)